MGQLILHAAVRGTGIGIKRNMDILRATRSALNVALSCACRKRNRNAAAACRFSQMLHVPLGVTAGEEVQLILQLHRYNAPAMASFMPGQHGQDLFQPPVQLRQIGAILLPQIQLLRVQPCGQGAAIPLGANVWTWAGNHVQSVAMRHFQKRFHVVHPRKAPCSGARLMEVPRDVDVNAVISAHPQLFHPFFPTLPGQTEIKQRRAKQSNRFSLHLQLMAITSYAGHTFIPFYTRQAFKALVFHAGESNTLGNLLLGA